MTKTTNITHHSFHSDASLAQNKGNPQYFPIAQGTGESSAKSSVAEVAGAAGNTRRSAGFYRETNVERTARLFAVHNPDRRFRKFKNRHETNLPQCYRCLPRKYPTGIGFDTCFVPVSPFTLESTGIPPKLQATFSGRASYAIFRRFD